MSEILDVVKLVDTVYTTNQIFGHVGDFMTEFNKRFKKILKAIDKDCPSSITEMLKLENFSYKRKLNQEAEKNSLS